MFKILKMLLFLLIFILLILFYAIFTDSGKKFSLNILSFIATQKLGLSTQVLVFDLEHYPYMKTKLRIEKKYTLDIEGNYEDSLFDLRYQLTSECIESNVCKVKGEVNIQGHIQGPRKQLLITGKGTALDGNVIYSGIKHRHDFSDVHIQINEINASKLFRLLGQKAIFSGAANGSLDFRIISHKKRQGSLYYEVTDKDYHGIKVHLKAQVHIHNLKHHFTMEVTTPTASLHLLQGQYNQKKRAASAIYVLNMKKVSDLKSLLKVDYNAPFYAVGEIGYAHKQVSMQGFSKSLGGMLDLVFKKDTLSFYLHNTALKPLLVNMKQNVLFDTNVTGMGSYNIQSKKVTFDAKLSDVVFKQSSLTQSLYKTSHIDLAKEHFTNNHFSLRTVNSQVSTSLYLTNKKNHLILKNTQINTHNRSMKSFLDFKIKSYYLKGNLYLKMDKYTAENDTYVNFKGWVQKHYAISLKGLINNTWTSMDYTVAAKRLPSHICTIVDDVNLTGHVNGAFKNLHISGKGTLMNGTVHFDTVQQKGQLEDLSLELSNIHAQKLSTLLGHPELPFGKVDLTATFDVLSTKKQQGNIHYVLRKSRLFDLPFTFDSQIKVNNKKEKFTANITLASAKIKLSKGRINTETNLTKTFYTLDVKKLSEMEKLLGYPYKGSFYAMGEVVYKDTYTLKGLSKTFGGMTEFHYDGKKLDIALENVSLKSIMTLFPYPKFIDAKTVGKIHYDFKTEKLSINTKLKNAKFLYIPVMDTIYHKSGVNMLKETFTQSTLDLTYHNDVLLANLMMNNKHSHVSLTNAQMNTKLNTINAYFDVNMQKKEFSGKVYGSLDNPKVNLNLQKLIRHEMDRQLDSIMGEGNRKMMQNMPMGGVAEDMASGVGGAFMGIFF